MKQTTLQTLYSYWNEVRAGRIAPRRLEIEPSRIAGILSETFMLERIDASTYQFRLAGTRLCELFGYELRGTNFLDGWSDAGPPRARAAAVGRSASRAPSALLTIEGGIDTAHRIELEAHPAAAPACRQPDQAHHRRHERHLGARIGSHSEPLRSRRLCSHEFIWPDGRPARRHRAAGHAGAVPAGLSGASVRIVKRPAAVSRPRRRPHRRQARQALAVTTGLTNSATAHRRRPDLQSHDPACRLTQNGARIIASLSQCRHSALDRSLTGPVLPAMTGARALRSDRQRRTIRCSPIR